MNNTEKDFILKKVNKLLNAVSDLEAIFERYDEEEVNDLISEQYPFDKSFEEVLHAVINWRDTIADKIFKLKESANQSCSKRIKYKGQIYEVVEESKKLKEAKSKGLYNGIDLDTFVDGGAELYRIKEPMDLEDVPYTQKTWNDGSPVIKYFWRDNKTVPEVHLDEGDYVIKAGGDIYFKYGRGWCFYEDEDYEDED